MDSRPDPFDLPGVQWQPLSPRLTTIRELGLAVWLGIPAIAVGVAAYAFSLTWLMFVAAGLALIWLSQAILIPRRVRAFGYACRADDVAIRSGIWHRRMVVVPYGRMQTVSVTSGPLLRRFGLAAIGLQTASSGSDATIPGINRREAEHLRDRLTALGEARMLRL
ncbi:PH domain-containing protein [Rarobacter faecitabidus]|uniref:YdbS-like PH domain-containing protein n=1 Tax=Rarobacter faecitabidus TaxID=13243 RepID=A0A542ZTK6_RARFA|nr:PH domain-containing protein [Rarobacter faecitabidus]TQL63681.1 hypothetical protein FB461_0149 [Rarobacter faecitabidus]